MSVPLCTVQYLEDAPQLHRIDPSTLVDRLRLAAGCLPFSHLLIGWHLPQPILDTCRREAEHLGLRFMLWMPLLTTVGGSETQGLTGHQVQGYQGRPEFTFACPNHPATQEAILTHLETLVRTGIYQGFFLDRVRFPSPSNDPMNDLACFCEHCCRKAAQDGLDLPAIRELILQQVRREDGRISLVRALLNGPSYVPEDDGDLAIRQFLAFRQKSIADLLDLVTRRLRAAHLEIGLDCFSPSLACLVGQDLNRLGRNVDWVKLMTYAHTFAPAGLPYELCGLIHFLSSTTPLSQAQQLDLICQCTGLPLPANLERLQCDGLTPAALQRELQRGLDATSAPILAGIELVDLPGIVRLDRAQIQADLLAVKRLAPAGLAISWDLLHITSDKLELVARAYFGKG